MIIAQISDTHIALNTPDADQRIRDFALTVADINALDPAPDVIVHTGDLVHNGRQDEYAQAVATLAKARAPVYVLAGNKDNRANLREAFSACGYLAPDSGFIDYAIDDYPVRLIALDTLSSGSHKGDFCPERVGPLAGILAGMPFAIATVTGAIISLTIVPIAFLWLHEPRVSQFEPSTMMAVYAELLRVFKSRSVWVVAAFLFLMGIPEAFQTPLYFYQKNELQFSDQTIGFLLSIAAAAGLLSTVAYNFFCRDIALKRLLVLAILCPAVAILAGIFYRSLEAAIIIEVLKGFFIGFGTLILMETAVLAAPPSAAAFGFAVLMSAWNGGAAIGDNLAAALVERWSIILPGVFGIYAILTALMICFIPLLPSSVLTHREK
jgi:3',5'-cyclic-AMP phosphodiesterase